MRIIAAILLALSIITGVWLSYGLFTAIGMRKLDHDKFLTAKEKYAKLMPSVYNGIKLHPFRFVFFIITNDIKFYRNYIFGIGFDMVDDYEKDKIESN